MNDENKRKHLEMIQNIVTRMGNNLFFLKGWSITIIAAIYAILAKDISLKYMIFAAILLIILWILDGYFLHQERCFRDLYDAVRIKKEEDIDYSMNIKEYIKGKNTWLKSMFSKTLNIFYGSMLFLIIIMIVLSNIKINISITWNNQNNNQIIQK